LHMESPVVMFAVQYNVHFNVKQVYPADRADGFKVSPVRDDVFHFFQRNRSGRFGVHSLELPDRDMLRV
jgi:hypothetical protein